MKDISPTLFLSVIMFGLASLVVYITPNIYLQLIFGIATSALIYIGGSYLFKFEELKESVNIFKTIKAKRNNS